MNINDLKVRLATFQELAPLLCLRKESVDLKPGIKTCYAVAVIENNIIGVVGWQMVGTTLRYKSDGVLAEYRGNGIYKKLWEFREKICKSIPAKKYSAFCTSKSLPTYLANGFVKISVNSNGITYVERNKFE